MHKATGTLMRIVLSLALVFGTGAAMAMAAENESGQEDATGEGDTDGATGTGEDAGAATEDAGEGADTAGTAEGDAGATGDGDDAGVTGTTDGGDGTTGGDTPTTGASEDDGAATGTTEDDAATTGTDEADDTGDGGDQDDLVSALEQQGEFGQTVDAIEQAGLTETLGGQGPFTLFAPTDEAWEQLSQDERDRLTSDEGVSRLRTVLSYHVVPDEILAEDIEQMGSVTTIQGQPLEVTMDGGEILVNDATVTRTGIEAGNGVAHAIDQVLMPQE